MLILSSNSIWFKLKLPHPDDTLIQSSSWEDIPTTKRFLRARYDLGCKAKTWEWAACTGCWLPNSLATFVSVRIIFYLVFDDLKNNGFKCCCLYYKLSLLIIELSLLWYDGEACFYIDEVNMVQKKIWLFHFFKGDSPRSLPSFKVWQQIWGIIVFFWNLKFRNVKNH